MFIGNRDSDTAVYNTLTPPITARYIRFKPVEWYSHISMRIEIYGCPGILNDDLLVLERAQNISREFTLKYLLHSSPCMWRFYVWIDGPIFDVSFDDESPFPSVVWELWKLYVKGVKKMMFGGIIGSSSVHANNEVSTDKRLL